MKTNPEMQFALKSTFWIFFLTLGILLGLSLNELLDQVQEEGLKAIFRELWCGRQGCIPEEPR